MSYLITQIWLCIIIAVLLGFILGWLVRGFFAACRIKELERDMDVLEEENARSIDATSFLKTVENSQTGRKSDDNDYNRKDDYDVTEIEGIGKGYKAMLERIGIETTREILSAGATREGREKMSEDLKLEENIVRKWVSMADLLRVPGIRGQFAELLEASGIKSVQQLAKQDVDKLFATAIDVNKRERRTRINPTREMVAEWVANAGELDKVISVDS